MGTRKPLRRGRARHDRAKVLAAGRTSHRQRRRRHRTVSIVSEVLALRRSLGKAHPRVVAVDDGAFHRADRSAPIAAVVLSAPDYVEAVRAGHVQVDGRDATQKVIALVRSLGRLDGVRAVMLDGAVLGGFNVVDLDRVHRALARPVVAVTRRPPEFARIRAALWKWFPRDARRRWKLLTAHRLFRVPTGGQPILAAAVGCSRADAVQLLRKTTRRGYWPEPLRLAHLIASAGAAPSSTRGARANS